jgi:hypothetical protein
MSDARPTPTGPDRPSRKTRRDADVRPVPGLLPDVQLARLADLIAAGETEVPGGLDRADASRLEALVRARLRARLVRFIARQIALDIHRDAGRGGK